MHLRIPTPMPRREQDATVAAMMGDILEAVNHVGDTEQEGEAAEAESPCTRFANPLAMQSALSLNAARKTIRLEKVLKLAGTTGWGDRRR